MSFPTNLWLAAGRRAELQEGNFSGLAALVGHPLPSSPWPDKAMQHAANALLLNSEAEARLAAEVWFEGYSACPESLPDLGKAHAGLAAAVLYDACHTLWPKEYLAAWQRDTTRLVRSFYTISSGNPHSITNNWWGVTHSGLYCAVAALRSSGTAAPAGMRSLGEVEEWAWQRVDAFLGHFGDAGAYHEGLGYQAYLCSFLLPACLLREARTGSNLADAFPGLRKMAALLLASAIEGPYLDDSTGQRSAWGRQLSWSDAGLAWPDGAVAWMALQWADPMLRPALASQWQRLGGCNRPDASPASAYGARFFQAVYAPSHEPAAHTTLPLQLCDRKQGLWLARSSYSGKDDAVLGAYARCVHPGGHRQDDAGSFRFSALRWDWVLGGGQARPEACWQSVVTSSDPAPVPGCGQVLWVLDHVFGMDLRSAHNSYSERYLALHPKDPIAVAVLDIIDDHRDDRDWTWNMTFSPEMAFALEPDGFRLNAPDGAQLAVRFLGTRPVGLAVAWSPPTSRTYANGVTIPYIARPAVRVRFPRLKPLNIYAVLTAARPGECLPPATSDTTLDISWHDRLWRRPFGLALPPDACPGSIHGQCKHPR